MESTHTEVVALIRCKFFIYFLSWHKWCVIAIENYCNDDNETIYFRVNYVWILKHVFNYNEFLDKWNVLSFQRG